MVKPPRYLPGEALTMLDVTRELMAGRPIFQGTTLIKPEQAKRTLFATLEALAERGGIFRAMENPEWREKDAP